MLGQDLKMLLTMLELFLDALGDKNNSPLKR